MTLAGFFDYDGKGQGDRDDAIDAAELEFLRSYDDAQWEALLAYTQTERFEAGQVVLALGSRERALFIVAEGALEVLVGRAPHTQRIALADVGDVVGEQVFLDGRERSAEVRAVSDSRLVKLGVDAFESFAALHPELARVFLFDLGRVLSLRLRQTTALLVAQR
ncbi:MAG: cyclic nucleotide-binding domain-containing protein [Myxococcota bacterium]